jgi:hypothetical protein
MRKLGGQEGAAERKDLGGRVMRYEERWDAEDWNYLSAQFSHSRYCFEFRGRMMMLFL